MMDNLKTYGESDSFYTKEDVPDILKWVAPKSRVLEFGPAYGYMTEYMKQELDCSVVAIELNPKMAENARPHTEQMIVANIETDNWAEQIEGTFDYIIFADVLEHLYDPTAVLKVATQFLSDTGSVLTSIPNIGHAAIIMCLMDGEFEYQKYGLLDDTHVHFFLRREIELMMSLCKLQQLDEKNIFKTPGETEFEKYLITHPSVLIPMACRRDSTVYQFVQKWEKAGEEIIPLKRKNIFKHFVWTILDDMNAFCNNHWGIKIKLPHFIKKHVR